MPILFPLTLIGVGSLFYAVFAGATLALPIAAGLTAGFGSASIGLSPLLSIVVGIVVFMGVIALGRFSALMLPSQHVPSSFCSSLSRLRSPGSRSHPLSRRSQVLPASAWR
jgi:hypothetical protein